MIRTPFLTALLSWSALLATNSLAVADTITLNHTGGGISQKIRLNGNSMSVTGGPFSWNVQAAPPNLCLECGASVTTWCVELSQSIGSTTTYTLTSVSSLANSTTIMNLFGRGYASGLPTGNAAAAFQLALWELLFDTSPSTVSSGNFQYNGSSTTIRNLANNLLTQALADTANGINAFAQYLSGYSLYLLTSSTRQDQLMLVPPCVPPPPPPPNNPIPAPPAAFLAALGILALGGRAAWLKRTPRV